MESQPPEHFISLPLVSKSEERAHLPLVVNVVARYWGEDIALQGTGEAAGARGAVMIDGISLAESRGFAT